MNWKSIIIVTSIFICSTCNRGNTYNEIVFQIADFEVTEYEFSRSMNRELYSGNNTEKGEVRSHKKINWKKEYVDRCYIIADALQYRLDTAKSIKKLVEYSGNYMMAQRYGYLWKETISPIVDAQMILSKEQLIKLRKLFYFDYIMSSDKDSLLRLTGNNTVLRSKAEFLTLKKACANNSILTTGYMSMHWPFTYFWDNKDYMYGMKEGEVSKLLENESSCTFLYLDYIEEVTVTDQLKKTAATEIQIGAESALIRKSAIKRDSICQPELNIQNIATIGDQLAESVSILDINTNLDLIHYTLDSSFIIVTYEEFLEYYLYQPRRPNIHDKESFTEAILIYYEDDYLVNEARKLNLFNSDDFVLDQRTYRNNLLYNKYIEDFIIKRVKIDTTEIQAFYQNNLHDFTKPKSLFGDLLIFQSRREARQYSSILRGMIVKGDTMKVGNINGIEGIVEYQQDIKLEMDSIQLSPGFKRGLWQTSKGDVSNVLEFEDGLFAVFILKEEEGMFIASYPDISEEIEYRLSQHEIEAEKAKLIEELKDKYKVITDNTGFY